MGPVNQGHAVEQEEAFHGRSLGGLSRRVQKSARLESEEEFQPQKGARKRKNQDEVQTLPPLHSHSSAG
jgi:hypothetical protein